MNQEEVGITFKDLLKMIGKRIWIVIAITLAATIVVTCFVQFGYNAGKRSYSVTYSLTTPALSSSLAPLYIGETQYSVNELIGEEVLSHVKEAGGESFASIDVEALSKDGAATVSQSASQSEKNTANVTISIPSTYFSSREQAEAFIGALAEYSGTYAADLLKETDYGMHLHDLGSKQFHTYEQKIETMSKQQEQILELYEVLIAAENGHFVVSYTDAEGNEVSQTLLAYFYGAEAAFGETTQEELIEEADVCGYILDLDYYRREADNRLSILDGMIANVDRQLAKLDAMLHAPETDELWKPAIQEAMVPLYVQKADCLAEQAEINANKALSEEQNAENNAEFDAKLDSYAASLQEQVDILQAVCVQYMAGETIVSNENGVSFSGGVNILLAVIAGLVIGLFCAVVVVYIMDARKFRKAKAAALASEQEEAGETDQKGSE